jgi:hypothetical protein
VNVILSCYRRSKTLSKDLLVSSNLLFCLCILQEVVKEMIKHALELAGNSTVLCAFECGRIKGEIQEAMTAMLVSTF